MHMEVAYGKARLKFDIPGTATVDHYQPAAADRIIDYPDFVSALEKAGGDRFLASEAPLIVVNDGHRNTPTPQILEWLDRYRPDLLDSARFLVAAGTHKPPTEKHYEAIFGRYYDRLADRISVHKATDLTMMTKIGEDRLARGIWLNKVVLKSEKVFIIGSVEPHYFAGFTGGRKVFFPGLTDQKTVERNHNLANSLDAAPLRLKGNPMAEDLARLRKMVRIDRLFTVQAVLDAERRVCGVFFGDLDEAFQQGVALAEKIYARRISRSYDAVICELLPPLDGSLYQAQKALENCQRAVKDGGAAIIISACDGGIGSREFYDLARRWDAAKNVAVDGKVHFGSHKLSRVIGIARRIQVRLHSNLPDEDARQVFYEPLADISQFLASQAEGARGYAVAIVHDAGNMVLTE
ncbi:MAG: lactate racemase domain-containing protein [candidate division Zixibacteria bacterium]|nr:lactate racemase domain-containing protein [candidate division Zixibacteria bacterium]